MESQQSETPRAARFARYIEARRFDPADFGTVDNQRHRVSPGITGTWQLSGGNGLTYEDMIRLDLAYIDNWSLPLDLWLLLRTVPALFVRTGPH